MISERLARGSKEIHEDMHRFVKSDNDRKSKNFYNVYHTGAELTRVCSICDENGVIHLIDLPYKE